MRPKNKVRSPQEIPRGLDYCQHMKNFRKVDCVPAKNNALYLNLNVFSRKGLSGDTMFTPDCHFTWSSEAREGLAAYRLHTYIHTYILYLNSSLSWALPPSILATNYMNIS